MDGLCKAIRKHKRRRARISREAFLSMINTRGSQGLNFPNTDFSGEDLSHMTITKFCFPFFLRRFPPPPPPSFAP